MDFHIVIPARYASSRLPGKPLLPIAGRPMILRVWDRALTCGAASVVVATDSERIAEVTRAAGAQTVMTSPNHPSGTDRLGEVVDLLGHRDDALVVNVQGDEPLLPSEVPGQLARALAERPEVGIATMATPIDEAADFFDPNAVKVVVRDDGIAAYFSRAPIPWVRDGFTSAVTWTGPLPSGPPFLRHLGLYAYRAGTLRRLVTTPPHALEEAEKLEQLRALAMGIPIHVTLLPTPPGHGVDTAEDLERVSRLFEANVTG